MAGAFKKTINVEAPHKPTPPNLDGRELSTSQTTSNCSLRLTRGLRKVRDRHKFEIGCVILVRLAVQSVHTPVFTCQRVNSRSHLTHSFAVLRHGRHVRTYRYVDSAMHTYWSFPSPWGGQGPIRAKLVDHGDSAQVRPRFAEPQDVPQGTRAILVKLAREHAEQVRSFQRQSRELEVPNTWITDSGDSFLHAHNVRLWIEMRIPFRYWETFWYLTTCGTHEQSPEDFVPIQPADDWPDMAALVRTSVALNDEGRRTHVAHVTFDRERFTREAARKIWRALTRGGRGPVATASRRVHDELFWTHREVFFNRPIPGVAEQRQPEARAAIAKWSQTGTVDAFLVSILSDRLVDPPLSETAIRNACRAGWRRGWSVTWGLIREDQPRVVDRA